MSYHIYFSKEARETATENITKLYRKLAKTAPTDQWSLQEIDSVMYYLEVLKTAIEAEQNYLDRKYGKK